MTTWREIDWGIDVQRAVAQLPDRQRVIFRLWLDGYNQDEIAAKMGKKHRSWACRQLKDICQNIHKYCNK